MGYYCEDLCISNLCNIVQLHCEKSINHVKVQKR